MYCPWPLAFVWLLPAVAALVAAAAAAAAADPSRGLSDHPIATGGPLLSLDGADWSLTSAPMRAPAAHSDLLPNCTLPAGGAGCCFANGTDWHNGVDGYGGKVVAATSPESCCAACTAAGAARCYVAVFYDSKCWLKTRRDAGGGNITARHPGTVSCMPPALASPLPPPPPPFRITGTVPGDLISDLESAGLVGDPYFENNFLNSSLWSRLLWSYCKSFTLPSRAGGHSALLVFEGVKSGARVYVDGRLVGNTTNQFRRYTFPLPPAVGGGRRKHTVRVTLDPQIPTGGRFMGCSGGEKTAPQSILPSPQLTKAPPCATLFWAGWDWAPYSNTADSKGALTFSSGIWKSVYVAVMTSPWAITHSVPTVFYRGADPTTPLSDGTHSGFRVAVKLFVQAVSAGEAAITASGSWGALNSSRHHLDAGPNVVTLELVATAGQVPLSILIPTVVDGCLVPACHTTTPHPTDKSSCAGAALVAKRHGRSTAPQRQRLRRRHQRQRQHNCHRHQAHRLPHLCAGDWRRHPARQGRHPGEWHVLPGQRCPSVQPRRQHDSDGGARRSDARGRTPHAGRVRCAREDEHLKDLGRGRLLTTYMVRGLRRARHHGIPRPDVPGASGARACQQRGPGAGGSAQRTAAVASRVDRDLGW
jgi:hypothetical protein